MLPAIIVIAIVVVLFIAVYKNGRSGEQLQKLAYEPERNLSITPSPISDNTSGSVSLTKNPSPTLTPTKKSASPTSTPIPTEAINTPTPKPFEEEEMMMRKTLSGLEMYIGTRNTAGALTFFTPPVSSQAKQKYEEIRNKNLPYGLRSWSYVRSNNNFLITEDVKNGYKVHMVECRINSGSCSTLTVELVRISNAENGFSIDRYYGPEYSYQNNLGEEIKYHGFTF